MRKTRARSVRDAASSIAENRTHPVHTNNGEEARYGARNPHLRVFMTFTKGLAHNADDGLVTDHNNEFQPFRKAIDGANVADFDSISIGGARNWRFFSNITSDDYRRWESPTAGYVYDLQGPDAQAVTMAPAPQIDEGMGEVVAGQELVVEMAEVYWWALLRDEPFHDFTAGSGNQVVQDAVSHLQNLPFYQSGGSAKRVRPSALNPGNLLRGQTLSQRTATSLEVSDHQGPFISQFLLIGSDDDIGWSTQSGMLSWGNQFIDTGVKVAVKGRNYMTHWNEWLDVQHGADARTENADNEFEVIGSATGSTTGTRFITTPRDLATFVHDDQLYQAYLNACLWLLRVGAPFSEEFQDELGKTKSTSGFALQGGPHILSLVTEVATRALKAVRYQKFNNHLRLRPEALAGRLAAHEANALPGGVTDIVGPFYDELNQTRGGVNLLDQIRSHNSTQNTRHTAYLGGQAAGSIARKSNLPLLPMAFPEGSPMHPTYGAGHATVAGACVTILKAFFNEHAVLAKGPNQKGDTKHFAVETIKASLGQMAFAYEARLTGTNADSELVDVALSAPLTVGGELNKLASNISIGRNMGGVHYYSDYIDSLRMGEEIACGILEEQALTYNDVLPQFRVSFTSFDGVKITIDDEGKSSANPIS